ncbi:minor core protein [Baboon orthoreovirus]|uniref:Minor core protein n=1 Tax=Baboon orthoreovirus TaxID=75888 RepID=G0YZM2_9REOV|nr:minor core protein [Baboon orthoreovirus]AEK86192.1 minor core protein [Baboon orthoreovirus]
MTYIGLPISVLDDSAFQLSTALRQYCGDVNLSDVFFFDQKIIISQMDSMSTMFSMEVVYSAILKRRWLKHSYYVLLPSKRRLVDYWRNNPDRKPAFADKHLFGDTRKAEFKNAIRNLKLEDHFSPLINENTDPNRMVNFLNQYEIVYTTSINVLGAKIKMYAPAKYYDYDESIIRMKKIFLHSQNIHDVKGRIVVGSIISAGDVRSITCMQEFWQLDNCYPQLYSLAKKYFERYSNTAKILSPYVMCSLINGVNSVKGRYDPSEVRTAKSLGLNLRARYVPSRLNQALEVCDIMMVAWDVYNGLPTDTSYLLKLVGVPRYFITLLNIEFNDHVIGTRLHNGMFHDWFMTLVMFTDMIIDVRTKLKFMLGTGNCNYVMFNGALNYHNQKIDFPSNYMDPIGVCMEKGSFKSTLVTLLTNLKIGDTQIFFPNTFIDSDDAGDQLTPTFEERLHQEITQLYGDHIFDNWYSDQYGIDVDLVGSQMYPIFLKLYEQLIIPNARDLYTKMNTVSRNITFAHTDMELLNGNWSGSIMRCHTNFVAEENIIKRQDRVGGVKFQLCLAFCYKIMGTSALTQPISLLLKGMTTMWLANADELVKYPKSTGSRVLAWYVPSAVLMRHGWCSCYKYSHVTCAFIRGIPEDLDQLDLVDFSKYRATLTIKPEVIGIFNGYRAVRVLVQWHTPKLPIRSLISRCAFTPSQYYHMSIHCNCELPSNDVVHKCGLTLARLNGEVPIDTTSSAE